MTSITATPKPRQSSRRAYWPLLALLAGLALGAMSGAIDAGQRDLILSAAEFIGGLWLNALKMTVIPLVVALLITGVAQSAETAKASAVAGRTVAWAVAICTASAIVGALLVMALTAANPLSRDTAMQLQEALGRIDPIASGPLPGIADFFKGVIPSNVAAAATNGDVLPLVVFALLFAMAVTKTRGEGRRLVVGFFEEVGDTLLVIIGWVLALAPIGVFALALTVGAAAGGAGFTGLGHYVLTISIIGVLVTLAAYPLAMAAGGVRLGRFTRALIAPQAVAISTRSSLASLPAMLEAARSLGVRDQTADVTLPIAVALFRATGPAMNTAVAFYVAHWLGIEPNMGQVIAAVAVGAVMSYGAVSLPGEVSFISSIAPIAMALGVPIAPLALLVAVEMVPDIFRTVGNVTMDVAVTTAVDRSIAPD